MPKASPRAGTETVSPSQTVDTAPRSFKQIVFEARWKIGAVALVLLVGLGVMAKNGWLGSSSPPYEGDTVLKIKWIKPGLGRMGGCFL